MSTAGIACGSAFAVSYEENNAEMLFKKGHSEAAIRIITASIKNSSEKGRLYAVRGRFHLHSERFQLAIADFDKAMSIDPSQKQDWIYRMRAEANANLHKYDAAIADLKKAIALKKNDEYFKMLGEIYFQQKHYDEAIDAFSRGIAINRKNYWLYRIRGDIYFSLKKYQKAVDDYTSAIRIVPNDEAGYGARAKAYEKMGLKSLADKDYAKTKRDAELMGDLLK